MDDLLRAAINGHGGVPMRDLNDAVWTIHTTGT